MGKKTCSKPPTSYCRKTNGLGYPYPTFECPKTAFFTGQGSKKPSRHSHRKVPASSIRRLLRVSWPAHFSPRDIIIWWYTYPSEKYEFVSCDDEIPNIWKNNKCSKPPTSDGIIELSNCKIEVSCVLLCMNIAINIWLQSSLIDRIVKSKSSKSHVYYYMFTLT